MKIDVTTPILDLDNNPIPVKLQGGDEKDMTLGYVLIQAAFATAKGDEAQTGDDKLFLFKIAQKVSEAEKEAVPAELTVEELSRMKKRIGTIYATIIVGRVFPLLDGE